ncbi:MAG TPA: hypothetical protein VJB89_02535 [Candidatus Nanoarchaeia archaeon]|nr:hypothetical protein [Candidatus Nanoarchaeia archaeon]
MVFIRLKQRTNLNGNEYLYAYLVKNEWKKRSKRVKQHGNKYLGRVYKIDLMRSMSFKDFVGDENYFEKKEVVDIFKNLIILELWKFGFTRIKKNIWSNGFFTVNLKYNLVRGQRKEDVVLVMSEGFLCSWSLNRLGRFRESRDFGKGGVKLAKMLKLCGIDLEPDIFVKLYGKISGEKT